jgi:hypothetical protein
LIASHAFMHDVQQDLLELDGIAEDGGQRLCERQADVDSLASLAARSRRTTSSTSVLTIHRDRHQRPPCETSLRSLPTT